MSDIIEAVLRTVQPRISSRGVPHFFQCRATLRLFSLLRHLYRIRINCTHRLKRILAVEAPPTLRGRPRRKENTVQRRSVAKVASCTLSATNCRLSDSEVVHDRELQAPVQLLERAGLHRLATREGVSASLRLFLNFRF